MANPTPPFPTAEAIVTEARMYVNDVAPTDVGNLLADTSTYTLANFNAAYRFALRELVRGYELESDAVRLRKVRTWREAEEFWCGSQNIWFSAKSSNAITLTHTATAGMTYDVTCTVN